MLATYRSYRACWGRFGAVGWQPTSLMGLLERVLWLYVGKSCGARWSEFGAVCWQPTCPMGHIDVGRFEAVCWHYGGVLGLLCGCMSAWRVLSYEACWKSFGGCMRCVGRSLGLYVGNLQVLWGVLERVWGCMLAPYKSYGGCWSGFGVVFWQPARLMGHVGAGVGCMLATYRSYGACWNGFGCMLATYRSYGACWNGFGCMLATYRSYGACLNGFGAVPMGLVGTGPCCNGFWTVCWQPTGLHAACWNGFGAVGWQPTGPICVLGRVWGCVLATYRSHGEFGIVCWQTTGLIRRVGADLVLYVAMGNQWPEIDLSRYQDIYF